MLAIRTGNSNYRLAEVAPYLLVQAARREGDWALTIYEPRPTHGFIQRICGVKDATACVVVLTENEYSRLSRTLYHGIRNNTKTSSLYANLENTAQTLWPTGSLDDVAMRHVGVAAVVQYVTRTTTEWGCLNPVEMFSSISVMRPKLQRIVKVKPPEPDVLEWDGKTKGPAPPPPPPAPPPGLCPPPPPGFGAPDVMECPAMPTDLDTAAAASEDGRTAEVNGVVAIVGQNYDKTLPINHMPIVGALVGPCQVKPNVYSKTAANIQAAINERIIKKARKPCVSKADKARIGSVVHTAMSKVFSKARVQEWAEKHFDLEESKSKRWSLSRFRNAVNNLYEKEAPRTTFKAGVKYENMPEGKAPRMLIADGDESQLMALAVVKCFEELLFGHFEERSIKHCSKPDALRRVVANLKRKGARAVEGDGSAWDTTCNTLVRGLIENPVLRHIMQILTEYGIIPESWMEEHQAACEQKTLKLYFANKFETLQVTIDAIRRSGHRGTSCLNWWVNFVMWITSVFKEPKRFLDPSVRRGMDLTGHVRWWNGCFEGDDSLCTLDPPMRPDDTLSKIFEKFWSDAGFNMKIVYCDKRATFVGWHIACDNGELTDFRSPELPRALANSGVSTSADAVAAAQRGDMKTIRTLATASALGRAADFAGIFPSVSRKYLDFALACRSSNFSDREMSMRTFGEEGHDASDVTHHIMEKNDEVTQYEECEVMEKLGYAASHEELMTFTEYVWDLDAANLTAYDAFRESLPASWRVEVENA